MAAVSAAEASSCLAVRLTPGQDLKDELLKLMKDTPHTSASVALAPKTLLIKKYIMGPVLTGRGTPAHAPRPL